MDENDNSVTDDFLDGVPIRADTDEPELRVELKRPLDMKDIQLVIANIESYTVDLLDTEGNNVVSCHFLSSVDYTKQHFAIRNVTPCFCLSENSASDKETQESPGC